MDITTWSKEQIHDELERSLYELEDLDAKIKMLKEELIIKIEGNGAIIGDKNYIKVKKLNFSIPVEKARDLGATKFTKPSAPREIVDQDMLLSLRDKGVDIGTVEEVYILQTRTVKND